MSKKQPKYSKEFKLETLEYIEIFCNRVRRHSALAYQSLVNFERRSVIA